MRFHSIVVVTPLIATWSEGDSEDTFITPREEFGQVEGEKLD